MTPDTPDPDDADPDGAPRGHRPLLPWWHRLTPRTRKVVRAALALTVTLLLAAGYGVLTASTRSSLGPHEADYSVSAGGDIVIDLGPLGSVLLDSPLPWPLGVDVVVHEIPGELTAVAANPVTGLAGDLAAYAQFFSAPDAAIADAVDGLVRDAVGRTVVAWSAMLVLIAAARFASRGLLRTEVRRALGRPGVAALVVVLVVGVGTLAAVDVAGNGRGSGRTVDAFAGTPLERVRITGRLGTLVDAYGGYVVDAYRENEAFYADVQDNLAAEYATDPAALAPLRAPRPSPVPSPTGTPTATPAATVASDDATTAPGEGTTVAPGASATLAPLAPAIGPQPPPSTEEAPTDDVEPVTFVVVSDLHCNVGMAPVIGELVRQSGAQALLDAGDTVMSGTSVESYCVNAFAQALPEGAVAVAAPGNHDSVETAEQLRDAGYTVLAGEVVEVAGVRILGDTDPTLTAIGGGTQPEREESVPEMGQRLADVACEAADAGAMVDLLLLHNPRGALPTLEEGCARLALSGHWHRRVGPEQYGQGLRYVSSSSAGAVGGGATIGPLNGEAELTVVRVDAETGRPLDYRVVTVGTDASVSLGRWFAFPDVVDAVDGSSGEQATGDGAGEAATAGTVDDGAGAGEAPPGGQEDATPPRGDG